MYTPISDTELAAQVLPHELICMHQFSVDVEGIRARAQEAVKLLATVEDDQSFDLAVPKVLMLLALLDHLTDGRTAGMIPDYLNF